MRKTYAFLILLSVAVVAVLVLGPSCRAQETSTKADTGIEVAEQAMPIQVEASPKKVRIHVQRNDKTIFTTPPYISICKEPGFCDGNGFEWVIVGGLKTGEKLTIKDAPDHPHCFPNSIPVSIEAPNNGALSGAPADACWQDKYGFYWPYIIEMELADGTTFSTDPGGIIRRRG